MYARGAMWLLGLITLAGLCWPSEAHAWGPVTHLVHGSRILENLSSLAPALQEIVGRHRLTYLYGCIAADIMHAKKYTRSLYTHCHCWPVGWQIVEAARDHGATHVWANVVYLRPGTREHFLENLARVWPELLPMYERLYAGRDTRIGYDTLPTAVFGLPQAGSVGMSEQLARARGHEVVIYRSAFRPMLHTLTGLAALKLEKDRIPALADVSRKLEAATDWRIARTPGLLDAHDFFSYLARRIFPCTDYIRTRSELDYTPAPDCFHDIFGHTPMIMHPRFANFYQKIGQAALACKDPAVEEGLTRIYWFTVEFGLIRNPGGLRIYGNGIISSSGETQHSLTDKVKKVPYRPETLAAQPYDIWHYQDTLFVIESFDQLEQEFTRWARDHRLL